MRTIVILWLCLAASSALGREPGPLLLRDPTLSATRIVFSYAGDLWSVSRSGGDAQRLTTGPGNKRDPHFSPDGKLIAFTAEYDGNVDVFVMPAEGGVPRRLTYHPAQDAVVGWTPDGRRVVFISTRDSYAGFPQLFTVPVEGGFPDRVPLPIAAEGSFSADGSHIAYVPKYHWQSAWKRYRGGQTLPIWIAQLSDSAVEKLPRDNSNDFNPMWVGDTVYFLSDRDGPVTLYAYNTATKKVIRLVPNDGLDIKSACAGPGAIVYEQFGSLSLFDLNTRQTHPVAVHLAADLPELRPRYVKLADKIRTARLSPSGARVVLQARGEIFTVPVEKGDPRNLTNSPGVMDRDPSWSPDGKWIAYFSDESGEYALHIREQNGKGEVRKIRLETSGTTPAPASFYYQPTWSPDSRKIAFTDKHLNLRFVDLDSGRLHRVDHDSYLVPSDMTPAWSPDSRWIAYTRLLRNHLGAIFLYSLETGQRHQLTDGMSDARMPAFDKNGKYLYFTASTDQGLSSGWLDMSSDDHPRTRSVYVVVLRKDLPSPLAPESDEEKVKEPERPPETGGQGDGEAGGGKEKGSKGSTGSPASDKVKQPAGKTNPHVEATRIDLEKLDQRILSFPIPARNYVGLGAGKEGILFLLEVSEPGPPAFKGMVAYKFDLSKRKADKVLEELDEFDISANGEKILIRQGPRLAVTSADAPKTSEGTLNLDALEVRVDPAVEWKQMYYEEWRIQRDFFYDPGLHGLDVKAMEARYEPFVEGVASRADLNYLFEEMLGEITCGHIFVGGGDLPEVKHLKVGLLGADYRIENGRYRFARIYSGENWNPDLNAPLTQPGVDVQEGEYLLAVNGRDLRASDEIYSFFEETAGRQTVLKVGPNPDGKDAREVTVVPVENEGGLRHLAWIEGNRRKVEQLSGGRLAYVHLPNTAGGGYARFNRYYFAQVGKEGAVIDERFNGGGQIADYIIDYLRRPLMAYWTAREGEDITTPIEGIFGPKAMIINEFAGSGGDAMPWLFRRAGIGPLIGQRTWGGLVGMTGNPELMDGGYVTVPTFGFYSPEGTWEIENHGVDPDIAVEMDPKLWREGHDPQLEKAVEVVMAALKQHPQSVAHKPAYPNYHRQGQSPIASRQ
jgi:tricorn protease